jgi:hypothetical protein
MEKAVQGGRSDARLKENVERVEKGGAITEEELRQAEAQREQEREAYAKFERVNQDMRSKNALQRIRGIRDLCAMAGADPVPMANYLLQADPDYSVREQAAVCLGNQGPAAKSALPHIQACLNEPNIDGINLKPEEYQAMLKQGDLKRACRDALPKIRR